MGGAEGSLEKAVENAGNDYTIEHIWPKNASKLDLTEEEEQIHDEIKHSLGNLTLAIDSRGSSWSNRPYNEKRQRIEENKPDYMNSAFQMTRKVAREHETWGAEQIDERLENLINFAQQRWSLDTDEREPYATIRPSEIE